MTHFIRFRVAVGVVLASIALLASARPLSAQITWSETTGLPGENITSVWGTAPDDLFAAGGYRTLDFFDGTNWVASPHPPGANRYRLFGFSATEIYSAGQYTYQTGNLLKYDGSSWSSIFNTGSTELFDVWGDGSGNLFTVGDGRFYTYNGSTWSEIPTGLSTAFKTDRLESVWGTSANNVYAVGANGNILHWDGFTLTASTPFGTGIGFNDIYGTAADDIYLVGSGGAAYHFDGTTWTMINTGSGANLLSIYALSPNQVMIGGSGGTLLWGSGTTFLPIPSGTTRDLIGIFALTSGNTDYWWMGASGDGRTEGGVIRSGTATHPIDTATVPEPGTMMLLATGLAGLAVSRRRKGLA